MDAIIKVVFSPDFVATILRVSTPLIFCSMGAVVVRKSGTMCIAFEGIMLFSALGAVIGSAFLSSSWFGLATGIIFGVIIMGLFAYFVLKLNANNVLTGLALNILASGGTVFLLFLLTGDKGSSNGLPSIPLPNINIPFIEDIPVLGKMLSGHNVLTYFALISVIVVYYLINRTVLGLRIRSVGENPLAAESVGINVTKIRVTSLVIGGVLASLGGVYMSMGYLPFFTRDMVAGRGFMSIAAQNLGGGNSIPTLVSALFFGSTEALSNVLQTINLPAELLQMVPYLATIIGLFFVGNKSNKVKINKMTKVKEI